MNNDDKKKPVVFIQGANSFSRQNTYVQNLLLKALSEGVTDPKELKEAAGLSKIADVYRSLDKLSIRKEYHNALVSNGVDLDFIVGGFKELAECGNDKIRLGSLNSLLKSIGLDKYEKQEESGKSWEEEILKVADEQANVIEGEIVEEDEIKDYEIDRPDTPALELKRQNEEKRLGRELYGD